MPPPRSPTSVPSRSSFRRRAKLEVLQAVVGHRGAVEQTSTSPVIHYRLPPQFTQPAIAASPLPFTTRAQSSRPFISRRNRGISDCGQRRARLHAGFGRARSADPLPADSAGFSFSSPAFETRAIEVQRLRFSCRPGIEAGVGRSAENIEFANPRQPSARCDRPSRDV